MSDRLAELPTQIPRCFFDTNIFVYSVDQSEPEKLAIAGRLIRASLDEGNGVISYQVIQEFLNVSLGKFASRIGGIDSFEFLRDILAPMMVVDSSIALFEEAVAVHGRYKLSWYDSLIVAAAIEARCSVLYTEDMQHGLRFGDLVVTNPFV